MGYIETVHSLNMRIIKKKTRKRTAEVLDAWPMRVKRFLWHAYFRFVQVRQMRPGMHLQLFQPAKLGQ